MLAEGVVCAAAAAPEGLFSVPTLASLVCTYLGDEWPILGTSGSSVPA
jgi:hypothetical protein